MPLENGKSGSKCVEGSTYHLLFSAYCPGAVLSRKMSFVQSEYVLGVCVVLLKISQNEFSATDSL